ncbi:hypothetical protein [Rubrobacter calidifluminis]|uniref:hypothetical protein n=1 Tax=Rubrobacter calidifluminis TaxID=1392640 RepID=UPI00235E3E27|nr:hypothetical protein [Rubrobacter calidifluminis]
MSRCSITQLKERIETLPDEERVLTHRLFAVDTATGRLVIPGSMRAWVGEAFGSVEEVEEQRIVRVTNRITLEGALFNGLRASRPLDTGVDANLEAEISRTTGDPFCQPEKGTPEDIFGRVRGAHSITASNIAKYDAFHGVIVFDEHDPLLLTPERVDDYVSVGLEWSRRVLETDPDARYFLLIWNCLWRAGGSIIHGHAQVTATRHGHYPKIEHLRRSALGYAAEYGSNYFEDLYRVHDSLGLSIPFPSGARGFASLTPVKEREVILLGRDPEDGSLRRAFARVLAAFVEDLGAKSFNVAFYLPPLAPVEEDWSSFPAMVRLVDRGSPANRTSDIGAMELYAAPVVASDPFEVAGRLGRTLAP